MIPTIKQLITKSCEEGMIDTKEHGEIIAWLERLEEPTEKMIQAMRFTNRKTLRGQLLARFKAGIKAAEEDA